MNFHDLLNIDFRLLPDEILNAIYTESHKERSKRRDSCQKIAAVKNCILQNRSHSIKSKHRTKCLEELLSDDWSSLYPESNGDSKYYVYAHVDRCKGGFKAGGIEFGGIPFYIGKGEGRRAFDLKRNEGHGAELRRILNSGRQPGDIVNVLIDGLTESHALCIESKLIHFFGTRFDSQKNGVLVNLSKPLTPYV